VPPYDAVLFDDDGVLVDPPAPGTQRTAVRDAFRAVGVNEFGPVSVMRGGAHDRGVLVSWHFWRHEFYKPMGTLHDADRGGFIFAPEVGVHEQVYEFDFSSLYPNIIVPETSLLTLFGVTATATARTSPVSVLNLRRARLPRERSPADYRCSHEPRRERSCCGWST
jgi:hypothetical protein